MTIDNRFEALMPSQPGNLFSATLRLSGRCLDLDRLSEFQKELASLMKFETEDAKQRTAVELVPLAAPERKPNALIGSLCAFAHSHREEISAVLRRGGSATIICNHLSFSWKGFCGGPAIAQKVLDSISRLGFPLKIKTYASISQDSAFARKDLLKDYGRWQKLSSRQSESIHSKTPALSPGQRHEYDAAIRIFSDSKRTLSIPKFPGIEIIRNPDHRVREYELRPAIPSPGAPLEPQIGFLIDRLGPLLSEINASGGRCICWCAHYTNLRVNCGGPSLGPALLKRLAQFRLPLFLDVFAGTAFNRSAE